MRFQKGKPRPPNAGRRKGTPNKASKTARELMEREGFNPLRRMMQLARETKEDSIKAQMYKELAKYYAPQLKAIEISGDPEKPIYLADAEARRRRIEELQAKLVPQPEDIIIVDAE